MFSAISDILNAINEAEKELGWKDGNDNLIYRGQANAWDLLPSLFRKNIDKHTELSMYASFCSQYAHLGTETNSLNLAYIMRHHGLPTRLLDWTSSLSTALFFSVYDTNVQDPCIWILDPYGMNRESTGEEQIVSTFFTDKDPINYFDLIEEENPTIRYPIVIYPPAISRRIVAQKGLFTIHGQITEPINKCFHKYIKKVTIPKESIDFVKNFLNKLGIDDYSMFPDVDGLCKTLLKAYVK